MALTPLPDPPQTADPANFATKADALVAALATMVTEINGGAIEFVGGTLTTSPLDASVSTFNLLATPTTVTAFAGASVGLTIGHASAAAAFPGGITVGSGKLVGSQVSWTPIDSSGAGLSLTVVADGCIAYKIGMMVYCFVDFSFPVTADATAISIGGLPYTSKDTTNDISANVLQQNGSATTMLAIARNNTTTFGIITVTGAAQTNATFSGASVRGCLIYPATA